VKEGRTVKRVEESKKRSRNEPPLEPLSSTEARRVLGGLRGGNRGKAHGEEDKERCPSPRENELGIKDHTARRLDEGKDKDERKESALYPGSLRAENQKRRTLTRVYEGMPETRGSSYARKMMFMMPTRRRENEL